MSQSTQERILEAAEHLFAEKGFSSSTLRDVTDRAGVNLASVNYHFGSKEALFKEMLCRRIEPINRRRIELLEEALSRTGGEPLSLEALYRVMLQPLTESLIRKGDFDDIFLGIIAQSFAERTDFLQKVHHQFVKQVADRFGSELKRSLNIPDLSEEEAAWRMYFSMSTIMGSLVQHRRISTCFPEIPDATDVARFTRYLIGFISGGMQAPAEGSPGSLNLVNEQMS